MSKIDEAIARVKNEIAVHEGFSPEGDALTDDLKILVGEVERLNDILRRAKEAAEYESDFCDSYCVESILKILNEWKEKE